jgi:hypothetical protein
MPVPKPHAPLPGKFQMVGKLMYTDQLDGSEYPLFAVGFRFKDASDDPWTERFNLFKDRDAKAVRAGVAVLQRGLDSITFHGRRVLVGAISSSDTELAATCPVRALCVGIAKSKGWEWPQKILTKRAHKSLHRLKTVAEREAAIDGAYTAEVIGGPAGTVMIVDDFVTRGSTAADVARAILIHNPGWKFKLISLAKTETVKYWGDNISNVHIPLSLDQTWNNP